MFSVPRVWRPAVQCNECSYPNDDSFQFCQLCGLQRYGSNALGPSSKKFKIDLEQLEARIKDLDSARASTAYQRQKSQLEAEFSGFLYNHARAYFPPHRGTLSDFWSGKMGRAKGWCTKTRVSSSVYRANRPVTVPLGYLQAQWTPLSKNCDLFSMRWAVPVTGMIALVLEILPRTYASSSILSLFNRSSHRPGYLRSKPPRLL